MSLTAAKALRAVVENKDIAELLSEDREIFGVYQPAYDFIASYYDSYKSVPTVELIKEKIGDDVFDGVPETGGSTKHYLNELREEYLRAGIEDMLIRVGENVHRKSPGEILDKIVSKSAELARHSTRIQDVDIMDIEKAMEHYRSVKEQDALGNIGLKTGIPVWDEFSPSGLVPGMNVVLFGYSGRAKSWIADLIAKNVYDQGKKVLFVSLEMSDSQQRDRVYAIAGDGNFTMTDLQKGNISKSSLKEFGERKLNSGGSIIVMAVDGVTRVTPNTIRSKIEKHKPDLVIVDYLQLMSDNQNTKEMTQRMLNISGDMKRMAVSSGVPVISISAVTDDEGKKRNSPPTIAQLAWSRAIEYDADLAVAVHKYEGTNMVELACRKNRNGEMFNMRYEVDLGRGIFEPYMESEDEED